MTATRLKACQELTRVIFYKHAMDISPRYTHFQFLHKTFHGAQARRQRYTSLRCPPLSAPILLASFTHPHLGALKKAL